VTPMRVFLSRLLDIVLRRRRESRLSEEIHTHLDLLTEQYIAQGLSSEDARAAARRSFGGVEQIKERYRDQRGLPSAGAVLQDFRFAVRMLVKDRSFAVTTVLALGLGVGAVNTVFALVNTTMIRDLPFVDPQRLVVVRADVEGMRDGTGLAYDEYLELARRVPAFEAILAHDHGDYATIGEPMSDPTTEEIYPPQQVRRTWVTPNTFAVLGHAPVLGRGFRAEDDRPGAPAVVVLSDDLWQWRYRADPTVIGRQVTIDNAPATIVGVMAPTFTFPMIAQMWQPLGASPITRGGQLLGVVARVRRDATPAEVTAQLSTTAKEMPAPRDAKRNVVGLTSRSLQETARGGRTARRMLWILLGMAALVLVIACANVASLLLARSMTRSREIAIRTAVGATRWRIVRQLLVECLVLAALAATLGAILSRYGARFLSTGFDIIEPGMPNVRPYWVDLSMNNAAYLFVAAVCLITTLAFGLGPALFTSGRSANGILKDGGRSGTTRGARWTGLLITSEIALTLILLAVAGPMWRSFIALYRADLVIDASRLMTMRVGVRSEPGQSAESARAFVARLNDRLIASGRLPAATMANAQIIGSPGSTRELIVAGRAPDPAGKPPTTHYLSIGDRFFETTRLPIVRGRTLSPTDGDAGREAAVVNERFAALFFPDDDPIGRRIQLIDRRAAVQQFPWLTIVGVSRSVPSPFANQPDQPVVYQSFRADPAPQRSMGLIIADMPLQAAASAVREEIRALRPGLAVYAIEPLEVAVARGRMGQKLLGTWLGILAGIGVLLASLGLYAQTSHSVVQRTQEIGIRVALGAPIGRVIWLFLRRSLTHLALGVAFGMVGALWAGKLFASFLNNADARDYPTTALVTLVLVAIATVASLLPARRASRVDPIVALRHE
jgi:putative ABC transport system permease protein